MSLPAGTRLGAYEIVSPLGAGGMGEVYKARDVRLDRFVAVKVLPSSLAADPQFRERFDREARAVSHLSHPHICTLHDVGEHPSKGSGQAIAYLVMELLDGETLAERLARGRALRIDEALAIGIQICDALAAAHRAGIVHRDLKPGNVMLTRGAGSTSSPQAKLLDFGLAKTAPGIVGHRISDSPAPVTPPSLTPTTPAHLTAHGTILGTFQYMAPEQIEGAEADARTDIFAAGCVIYEMVTGRKAFTGKTQASLLGAIMTADPPPVSVVQPIAPAALDRVVKRCLAKDPDDRWQDARDLAAELRWIAEGASQPAVAAAAPRRAGGGRFWIAATAASLLTALALAAAYFRASPAEMPLLRLSILPPENATFAGDDASVQFALSPDGRRLAFVAATGGGRSMLWIRSLDTLLGQPLAGTDEALFPFWSPDSRFVGFFAQSKLKKIAVSGGPAQTLCEAGVARGGAWAPDGSIVFGQATGGLSRVTAMGGLAAPLTTLDPSRKETSHRWPHMLPDGRHFLYKAYAGADVYVGSLDSTPSVRLLTADSEAMFAAPSHLLFIRDRTLMAQRFDVKRRALSAEAVPVAEQIGFGTPPGHGSFTVSDTGMLAYAASALVTRQLTWVDRDGKAVGAIGQPGSYGGVALAPDEKRAAIDPVDQQTGTIDIWLVDAARGITSRFTFDPASDWFPVWSPDAARIAFRSDRGGGSLYLKPASGAGQEEMLLKQQPVFPTDWSPDARYVLYHGPVGNTLWDLFLAPMAGERKPIPFLQTPYNEVQGRFSRDGRWIAYASDETGAFQVYVQPFPATSAKYQISTSGGSQPQWGRNGRELFYLAADRTLMAVSVKTGSVFEAENPRTLFQTKLPGLTAPYRTNYAVSADGRRFLMPIPVADAPSMPITIVVNWANAIKN